MEIAGLSRKEIDELIEQEQKKVIGTLHKKVAIMRGIVNIYNKTHDKELFDEIKNYMKLVEKDICFSENLDIYMVNWYICTPENLKLDSTSFGFGKTIEFFECDCSQFSENRICSHIDIYKKTSFDPSFIPDNADHYSFYDDIQPNSYSYKKLLEKFPRWILEYLLNRWLKYYSIKELAKIFKIDLNLLIKLQALLKKYRRKRKADVKRSIISMIKNKDLDVLWLPCEATEGELTKFPEVPKNSSQFKFINLEDNRLILLPDSFSNFSSVERLHVQRNYLQKLPDSFSKLEFLKELNLEHNMIRLLPDTFGNLKSLSNLNLSHNYLVTLPATFYKLHSLEILNLSNNKGLYISESFNKLRKLRNLDLDNNGYIYFPKPLCRLENLKELSLASNKLKSIPESIGTLTSLKSLDLHNNVIENYPKSLRDLKKLEFLRLGCVSHSVIPDFLIDFLIELETKGANLGIPQSIFDELKK